MEIPQKFLKRMKQITGEEFQEFYNSLQAEPTRGLRVNTLKINIDDFLHLSPFHLEPVPWARDGFYYSNSDRPGQHPYHAAGLYYLQEPSAMAPVSALEPQPGEKVLDLCAAPGGKSTQIAAAMEGKGVLVSNEINPVRVKALVENLERFGVKNAFITNEKPPNLVKTFHEYFDKILVDAPCSGEGMFRKDPGAWREWSIEGVQGCSFRQTEILVAAAQMLRPGGIIAYSTCTFSPEENEGVLEKFLFSHSEFDLIEGPVFPSFAPGLPHLVKGRKEIGKSRRLWPHKLKGEGHFFALLKRKGSLENFTEKELTSERPQKKDIKNYFTFAEENLNYTPTGRFKLFGSHLYIVPEGLPDLKGIKITRAGWYLGELKKNRFEPSHALALSLKKDEVKRYIDLRPDSPEIIAYLRGETLNIDSEPGWTLVTVNGYPLGWGKQVGGILKNHYPRKLRR